MYTIQKLSAKLSHPTSPPTQQLERRKGQKRARESSQTTFAAIVPGKRRKLNTETVLVAHQSVRPSQIAKKQEPPVQTTFSTIVPVPNMLFTIVEEEEHSVTVEDIPAAEEEDSLLVEGDFPLDEEEEVLGEESPVDEEEEPSDEVLRNLYGSIYVNGVRRSSRLMKKARNLAT